MVSRFSIVTPSLNQGRFVDAAIQSVLSQQYPDFEHIIVDGGSTDNTLDILKKYSHLNWVSEPDRGQSDALNKGFRMASGDIVGWLNADDLYLPGCFGKVANYFKNYPNVDVVYGDIRWIDSKGEVTQLRREINFDRFMLKYLHILYIPTASTFMRRQIFDDGHFLDVDYHYAMDYEFVYRLADAGYRFAHIPAFLADFRWHLDNKSSDTSGKQGIEHRKVQMDRDPLLSRFSSRRAREVLLRLLTFSARTKRYFAKGIRGYYLTQWRMQ